MKVGIAYALPNRQVWFDVDVPDDGATIRDAIERSGILKQFPDIDLEQQKVGVFGKVGTLDTALASGDRVEIYRPIICDPKTVRRRPKAEGDAQGSDTD